MPLKHILGIDHVVVSVHDLDASAAQWKRLGFTLSPRGVHSAHVGTANHTMMFGEDYLELVGVLTATDQNEPTRNFLKMREGIERTAFTTDDAAAGVAELAGRGLKAIGPMHFGRPVQLPGGGNGEAKFNIFRWPLNETPGGMRIFACQHLTRNAVWIPEFQKHANGATRIKRVEILSGTPKAAAEHLGRLIEEPVLSEPGIWRVRSGGKRADFLFYDQAGFAERYPDAVRAGAPAEGAAAIVIATIDLAMTAKSLGSLGVSHENAVSVPAKAANCVVVSFVPL